MAASVNGTAESESVFSDMALELFSLQFERVTVLRQFCEARGRCPAGISDWAEIPALPTRAFQDFEISSLPEAERTCVFLSSGTSSQSRSRHYHGAASLKVYENSLLRWFAPHIVPEFGCKGGAFLADSKRLLVLAPRAVEAPHSSLVHMFETVARRIPFARAEFAGRVGIDGGWALDTDGAVMLLEECARGGQPVVILGTAFSFVHLLDELTARGRRFELPRGSCAMETGGYKGRSRSLPREELHALIGAGLGLLPGFIVREYGMSELSSQAYDRVAGDTDRSGAGLSSKSPGFRFPPWARMRVVSPETGREVDDGQTGIVRVFDLANVYSAFAVQTEDLAVRRGATFELLGRAAESQPRGCSLMMESTVHEPA